MLGTVVTGVVSVDTQHCMVFLVNLTRIYQKTRRFFHMFLSFGKRKTGPPTVSASCASKAVTSRHSALLTWLAFSSALLWSLVVGSTSYGIILELWESLNFCHSHAPNIHRRILKLSAGTVLIDWKSDVPSRLSNYNTVRIVDYCEREWMMLSAYWLPLHAQGQGKTGVSHRRNTGACNLFAVTVIWPLQVRLICFDREKFQKIELVDTIAF